MSTPPGPRRVEKRNAAFQHGPTLLTKDLTVAGTDESGDVRLSDPPLSGGLVLVVGAPADDLRGSVAQCAAS